MSPVLYAEDEPDDVFFLQLAWKDAGVPNPLLVVKDGQEAIEYLDARGRFANRQTFPLPGLLLLDLKLPICDGFEVLHWLRKHPTLAALRVVIVSGSEQEQDVALARSLGAVDYLVKPSSPTRLTEIVREGYPKWLAAG